MSEQVKVTVVDDITSKTYENVLASNGLSKRKSTQKPKGGTINGWYIDGNVIRGILTKDPQGRGFDNRHGFHTSYVRWFSYDPKTQKGVAETRNTVYNLGNRMEHRKCTYRLVYNAPDEPCDVPCYLKAKDKEFSLSIDEQGFPLAVVKEEHLHVLENTRKHIASVHRDCNYKIVIEDYVYEPKASYSQTG